MRPEFFEALYKAMQDDERIVVLTGDLGYGGLDKIRNMFPERFINCGAAEFTMVGIACGLALEGKIPFVYSITPFLVYRAFEMLRTYVEHENIPIKLCGGGRDNDYEHDGYSHNATDAKKVLDTLPNIQQLWPEKTEEIYYMVGKMIGDKRPYFISLKR